METDVTYDCAVIGAGLAGLCLAIQLADKGLRVIVFEKNDFPASKVCGEYISMESHDFLCRLGLPLSEWQLPCITELGISSEQGFMLNAKLDLGGFGISRYTLDYELYKLALRKGVTVFTQCKVQQLRTSANGSLQIVETSGGDYTARLVCGSYGKYTPAFMRESDRADPASSNERNYIAVKYHIRTKLLPHQRIELHNFRNGYCGISRVDKDWHCLCYLSAAENLRENRNNIAQMEKNVLYQNPYLERYFTTSDFVSDQPLVISNVQFTKKQPYANKVFLLGDAAGSISPLCGNGMSMGMRASRLLAEEIGLFFDRKISLDELADRYARAWDQAFNLRITAGYYLQRLFGKKTATHLALKTLSHAPGLTRKIISLTHGKPF